MARHDDARAWLAELIGVRSDVEEGSPHAGSGVPAARDVGPACQARTPRGPLARQRLRCLVGVFTVSRRRPFLRRYYGPHVEKSTLNGPRRTGKFQRLTSRITWASRRTVRAIGGVSISMDFARA